MALFYECMQWCAQRVLDTADIVRDGDISTVDEGSRYNLRNVTNFSNWPEWLKVLVLVPHGILASEACWLWWPKSEKGWRRFGFVVAYLLLFYVVMRYVFQMKDFK